MLGVMTYDTSWLLILFLCNVTNNKGYKGKMKCYELIWNLHIKRISSIIRGYVLFCLP